MQNYTVKAQQRIYMNRPKKTLEGDFTASQGGPVWIASTQIRGSQDSQKGGWTAGEVAKDSQKANLAQGGHQVQVHLDQMVLVIARRRLDLLRGDQKCARES
jgi:hypothetical protein